ncbi:transcriptional regulator, GntR family [Pseudonocardia thermophila]|uniref:Transcriptional regulator, GntR family n=1 Tax=Pseudonocardia thermophila TaxID=1848 RepID=A0A1M6P8P9_PSETH|nr:GntR family transcriptional regulator [Pseudonocardia thermophila]SHK04318.1 transcriptional regulator, GntR family [Pseudonocardia thermophila]
MPVPDVALDRSSPVPLYYQVATRLEQLIDEGELPAGSRLENEIELADRLGVSRPTMRRAIQYLVERGLLVRKRGVGTQVVHPKVRRPVELTSLYDDLAKSGQDPRTEVRSLVSEPLSDHVAGLMGLAPGTPATRIERLRYAAGEPLALMTNIVPADVLELSVEALTDHGLYDLLRAAGRVPRMARQVVGARAATPAEARLLGEPAGTAVLTMTRTAWDAGGQAVEYGSHIYRASRYSFELTLTSA